MSLEHSLLSGEIWGKDLHHPENFLIVYNENNPLRFN